MRRGDSPLSVAVTLVTCPASPLTKMFDGYGVAGADRSGTVIVPVLQYVVPVTTVALSTRCVTVAVAGQEAGRTAVGGPDQVGALGQRGRGDRGDA